MHLMWTEDVPLFVTGRLASLRLGPGAGDLTSARAGAEKITWSSVERADEGEVERFEYATGRGNRFERLKLGDK